MLLLGIMDNFYPNKASFNSLQWDRFLNNVDRASAVGADAAPVTTWLLLALVSAPCAEGHVTAQNYHHLRPAVRGHTGPSIPPSAVSALAGTTAITLI